MREGKTTLFFSPHANASASAHADALVTLPQRQPRCCCCRRRRRVHQVHGPPVSLPLSLSLSASFGYPQLLLAPGSWLQTSKSGNLFFPFFLLFSQIHSLLVLALDAPFLPFALLLFFHSVLLCPLSLFSPATTWQVVSEEEGDRE